MAPGEIKILQVLPSKNYSLVVEIIEPTDRPVTYEKYLPTIFGDLAKYHGNGKWFEWSKIKPKMKTLYYCNRTCYSYIKISTIGN